MIALVKPVCNYGIFFGIALKFPAKAECIF